MEPDPTAPDLTADVQSMLTRLRGPRPVVRVERPCTLGDGILQLDDPIGLEASAARIAQEERLTLFLPAAGAATRFLGPLRSLAQGERAPELRARGAELALWPAEATSGEDAGRMCLAAYEGQPKGLVPFHHGPRGEARTPTEEHLREAVGLGAAAHLVVSPEHLDDFRGHVEACLDRLQTERGVRPRVSLSVQSPSTRTVALREDGEPARHDDGSLLWRPGGHGALLESLDALRGDLVLIENIDNVSAEAWRGRVLPWRRRLVGALVALQDRVHGALASLDDGQIVAARLDPVLAELGWPASAGRDVARLRRWLDRPLRVCAMVPNDGHPGGGPFWVRDGDDGERPQIVEGVQLDPDDPEQASQLAASTHFNPVDLACAVRDRHGRPYDLTAFADDTAWIVTDRSWRGSPLRALERPGLWNGGMAHWNTIFVELPADAFTPVKTVLDLLRAPHLSGGLP